MSTSHVVTLIILMIMFISYADLVIKSRRSSDIARTVLYGLIWIAVIIGVAITLFY